MLSGKNGDYFFPSIRRSFPFFFQSILLYFAFFLLIFKSISYNNFWYLIITQGIVNSFHFEKNLFMKGFFFTFIELIDESWIGIRDSIWNCNKIVIIVKIKFKVKGIIWVLLIVLHEKDIWFLKSDIISSPKPPTSTSFEFL